MNLATLGWIINIGRNNFGAQPGKLSRFVGVDVSGDRPRREIVATIPQNAAYQTAALSACGAHHCNYLSLLHIVSFPKSQVSAGKRCLSPLLLLVISKALVVNLLLSRVRNWD
jgi:hypothetical protein